MRHRKYLISFILVITFVLCSACQRIRSTEVTSKRKIIIDVDAGADDGAAIMYAAEQEELDILGVTVLKGNVDLEQGTKNILMALEMAGREVPVYKGSDTNYKDEDIGAISVFGNDGMGDMDLIHPSGKAEDEDAIDFIIDTVKANPDEVELVVLGPATNIAKAMEKDPETMKKVKMIWSMGTCGLGPGNATPVAEFNVYHDPEAYDIMLNFGVPVTVIGFDMCGGDAAFSDVQFDRIEKMNEKGEFFTKSFTQIREFYKDNRNENLSICDLTVMECVADPSMIVNSVQTHAKCITAEGETRGEVVFYQEGITYDVADNDFTYNVTLTLEIEGNQVYDRVVKALR
jgi:purine nucleosidase